MSNVSKPKQDMVPMLPENTNTIMNADEMDWNEMAALLSPVKAKDSITPEVAARIESNKKAAEARKRGRNAEAAVEAVDWDEMAALLSPVKAKNCITPEVAARIANSKRAAETRKACVELGYPLLSAIFTPAAFASNVRIIPSSLPDEADLWKKEEQKRQQELFIRQIERGDLVMKRRKEERLAFLQKQKKEGTATQEVFEEIDKEINFLENFMRTRFR